VYENLPCIWEICKSTGEGFLVVCMDVLKHLSSGSLVQIEIEGASEDVSWKAVTKTKKRPLPLVSSTICQRLVLRKDGDRRLRLCLRPQKSLKKHIETKALVLRLEWTYNGL
jgi:hypothetical protein